MNILVKEKYELYIFKDTITSYRFINGSNPVIYVKITGNTSAGAITTSVEVLKNTSTLVKTPATGLVYMNMNIWVGTSGFAVPKNIKTANRSSGGRSNLRHPSTNDMEAPALLYRLRYE